GAETGLPGGRRQALTARDIAEERSRNKTAEADQAGVERLWAIRDNVCAHRGMNAIGADDETALGNGAVGEMRDDGLVGAGLDGDKPLLEPQLDILAPGLVGEGFVQRGAAHVHRRLAEALSHVLVDGTEAGA